MNLGNNILELRKQMHLSQEKLGEKVGVTRQTISNWELEQTTPDTHQLIALAKALNVSIDTLVDNDIHNLLEQKVNHVELEVVKNNKLLKISIIVLTIIVIILILAFISLA
jgi:transcriptional regulator with XRE-family HTH domain